MDFADIHIHALSGTDDGPDSDEETFSMIDDAYSQGVRAICFTPHWYPLLFGNNRDKSAEAFEKAKQYIQKNKYQMLSFLGNELRYSAGAIDWLRAGSCRMLNGTKFVLVDFRTNERKDSIIDGIRNILNLGCIPVVAHAERYSEFGNNLKEINRLKSYGVRIQLDAGSILGEFGLMNKIRSHKLLSEGLADIVSSDAHSIGNRPILLNKAYDVVRKKYTDSYAEKLFWKNPYEILIE